MKSDYGRNVSLLCPVCGNDQFSAPDLGDMELLRDAPDDARIQCSDCKTIFTKSQLIEENQEQISAHVEEIEKEVVHDLERELNKAMKKIFK
ncbi:MAG: hypothetical protein LUF92_11195 [Clostridiales bacterium]|nr:hypothetical protein [Clostridiales bacterium]